MNEDNLSPVSPDLPPSAAVLRAGLAMSDLSFSDLYAAYLAVGGTLSTDEVCEILRGQCEVIAIEHDYLAQALNDHFTEHGHNHPVPYHEDLDHPDALPNEVTRRRQATD